MHRRKPADRPGVTPGDQRKHAGAADRQREHGRRRPGRGRFPGRWERTVDGDSAPGPRTWSASRRWPPAGTRGGCALTCGRPRTRSACSRCWGPRAGSAATTRRSSSAPAACSCWTRGRRRAAPATTRPGARRCCKCGRTGRRCGSTACTCRPARPPSSSCTPSGSPPPWPSAASWRSPPGTGTASPRTTRSPPTSWPRCPRTCALPGCAPPLASRSSPTTTCTRRWLRSAWPTPPPGWTPPAATPPAWRPPVKGGGRVDRFYVTPELRESGAVLAYAQKDGGGSDHLMIMITVGLRELAQAAAPGFRP